MPPLVKGQQLELLIEGLSYGGRGVARADGYVVFVPYTAPGDRVRVRVTRARRTFGEAELVEVLQPSPDRVPPPCPYFGPCGGCTWQHLSYSAQLRVKQQIVIDSLQRLGGLRDLPVRPIVGAPDPYHYRNKMEFAFHPDSVLGLHARGHFDRVVGIDACLLPSPLCSEILREVKAFVRARAIPCYDNRTRRGLLRHLVYREGVRTGEVMVGIVTVPGSFPDGPDLAASLVERHPQIRSIAWAQSGSLSDAVRIDRLEVLHGRDHIFEELAGRRFAIRLETFFQTNTQQAEDLAVRTLQMAELRGGERVVDLYCGVGTFALLLAEQAGHVWGIEVVPAAVEAARENAARAGATNVEFASGDARRLLPDLVSRIGSPDVLVLDPPRSGAGGKVMRKIGRARPQRVIYVSCNPTTLAPDLAELLPFGYEIREVQPVDLFPQTYHVETLVRLDRVGRS
ncbi:MAG: 23S rRNA (uracil(1939)-C(5))-methyltransferase RlmD [Armatimonadota bacterium]|nr:23S rRNA (uracil(1939)-C(5))-methyltransferase RlmD [Armatimonadota bacterium]MDR5697175.1 23S rRNA (uracil(1939)-C(5))-methyltransferase RlmD [Armatimonadota bacterium]